MVGAMVGAIMGGVFFLESWSLGVLESWSRQLSPQPPQYIYNSIYRNTSYIGLFLSVLYVSVNE